MTRRGCARARARRGRRAASCHLPTFSRSKAPRRDGAGAFEGLAAGRYGCILTDPPWAFRAYSGDKMTPHRTALDHYPVMDFEALAALPVKDLAARDCALFMWAVGSHLDEALKLGEAWGFRFVTDAFDWLKERMADAGQADMFTGDVPGPRMGFGYRTRKQVEPCLLFARGKPRRLSNGVRQAIVAPIRAHSQKPDVQYGRIEALVAGPYAELFSRHAARGLGRVGQGCRKVRGRGMKNYAHQRSVGRTEMAARERVQLELGRWRATSAVFASSELAHRLGVSARTAGRRVAELGAGGSGSSAVGLSIAWRPRMSYRCLLTGRPCRGGVACGVGRRSGAAQGDRRGDRLLTRGRGRSMRCCRSRRCMPPSAGGSRRRRGRRRCGRRQSRGSPRMRPTCCWASRVARDRHLARSARGCSDGARATTRGRRGARCASTRRPRRFSGLGRGARLGDAGARGAATGRTRTRSRSPTTATCPRARRRRDRQDPVERRVSAELETFDPATAKAIARGIERARCRACALSRLPGRPPARPQRCPGMTPAPLSGSA